ncbi:MAG: IclR family transcriptional regulator [Terriglobales bacterium]
MTAHLGSGTLAAVQKKAGIPSVYRVQVLDRAFAILNALADARDGLGLSELATLIHVHKSTTHRIVMNLERHRLIERDPASGKYRLGLRLFELGSAAIAQFNVRDSARKYLESLVNETGETVHLCVMDAGEMLYLDKIEPTRTVRLSSRIGLRNPAHCTAVGKAIMAWLTDAEVETIVQRHGLRRFTGKTITTLAELKADLAKIRACGYAIDDEEHEDGVRCIAAAVRDHSGRPAAAMSVSGPSFRIPPQKIPAFAQSVCRGSRELSREWGFDELARKAKVSAAG